MPRLDFYNENAHRFYPLIQNSGLYSFSGIELANNIILDVGFILGTHIDFTKDIKLNYISKSGDDLIFSFDYFNFSVNHVSDVGNKTIATGLNGSAGYLVTGNLNKLYTLISGTCNADTICYVEPITIQCLKDTYVTSITIASAQRDPYKSPDGCATELVSSSYEEINYYVTGTGLTGDLQFKEGYNASIRILDDKTIEIGAGIGSGVGEPCVELEVFNGELISANQFDGPECDDLLYTINGIEPINNNFTIDSKTAGLVVINDSSSHTILITFNEDKNPIICPLPE